MDGFTLDDYANLSEDAALRRQFDASAIRAMRFLAPVGLFAAFTESIAVLAEWRSALIPVMAATLMANALLFFAIRRTRKERLDPHSLLDRLAGWVESSARPIGAGFLLLHFFCGIALTFGEDVVSPWLIATAYLAIAFRFTPSNRLIFHAILAGATIATRAVWPGQPLDANIVTSAAINQGIAFFIGIWSTHRARVRFLREWRRERENVREQLRMREELEFARQIQLSMLPRESPALDWLDISAMSLPATEVGGDYFDYFEIDDGRLAIVSADVAGHGMASGIVLSGIRSCLTLLSNELANPTRVMEKMQQMVRRTARHRMLVTLTILVLDRDARKATITSAGHPPVFVRRRDGRVEEITIESLPLGAPVEESFDAKVVLFEPGDMFVVQTDGVYETLDANHDYYGLERLATLLAGIEDATAQAMRDAVVRDLWTFKGSAAQEDDITLVVARVV